MRQTDVAGGHSVRRRASLPEDRPSLHLGDEALVEVPQDFLQLPVPEDHGHARAVPSQHSVRIAEEPEEIEVCTQPSTNSVRSYMMPRRSKSRRRDSEDFLGEDSLATPGRATMTSHLDAVLATEFGQVQVGGSESDWMKRENGTGRTSQRLASVIEHFSNARSASEALSPIRHELGKGTVACVSSMLEHKFWTLGFMALTFYSIFASDLDVIFGDKESKVTVSIVTMVAFVLFFLELVLQSWSKPRYVLRSYFWLDLIALLSLLPDTYILQVAYAENEFAAGGSYWLLRILRLSRSSKAARLNRLTRIARVAALMPRLLSFGRQKQDDEAERLMEKKLYRIFTYLDEDMSGTITQQAMMGFLAKIKEAAMPSYGKLLKTKTAMSLATSASSATSRWRNGSPKSPPSPTNNMRVEDQIGAYTSNRPSSRVSTATSEHTRQMRAQDSDMVSFQHFLRKIRQDEWIRSRLLSACRQQMRQSNNMQNLTARHSEDVGVKVALGVLLMLLVLTLVLPSVLDYSALQGLEHIQAQVSARFSNLNETAIPLAVQTQVRLWARGVGELDERRILVYLDVDKRVYCNELVPTGQRCMVAEGSQGLTWTPRRRLEDIGEEIRNSDFRRMDLVLLRLPDLSDADVSQEELDRRTRTVALLNGSRVVRQEAVMSVVVTVLVIIIILLGIVFLTKDLTFLSRSLLKPLRDLADEMQSIVQLQLAGLTTEPTTTIERGTAEIRQIQRIFENMKKAIKSWGKYVPWPVVQLLLHAGVDAKQNVEEKEVTVFFSDIASFTSIVESIPPEDTLLLLSRYFNDMSRVIDDHGGIVVEFIGDAILSIYGAPMGNAEHATLAVKSTLRMLSALARLNEWSAAKGLPEVKVRCGVHTGRVLVGNMGFHSRIKYGVVGESTNITGRLEELNKTYSTEMLISETTYSRLDPDAFVIRPIDFVYLRNVPSATSEPIYQVMARDRRASAKAHRLRPAAQLHAEAMELYRSRRFEEAAEAFGRVGEAMQEQPGAEVDVPSSLMMKRCRAYARCPPRADWDGVWDQAQEPG